MKYLLFSIGLSSIITLTSAQNLYQLKGTVKDENQEALVGVSVIIINDSLNFFGAATDLDGNYTIHSIPDSIAIIKVSYIGYSEIMDTVPLPKNAWITMDYIMRISTKPTISIEVTPATDCF
jgi:hypothetical protein